jgi:hypothetical protein
MSPGRSLLIGLIAGVLVAAAIGSVMLDNNNQGEFADVVSGRWTFYFWQLMFGIGGVVACFVSLSLALIRIGSGREIDRDRPDT